MQAVTEAAVEYKQKQKNFVKTNKKVFVSRNYLKLLMTKLEEKRLGR